MNRGNDKLFHRLIAASAMIVMSCSSLPESQLCPTEGKNLIEDADFAAEANNKLSQAWGQSQHAGENSFETDIQNGALTISKIGSQPWFSYKQTLAVSQYAGQKMVFSADLKLDLQPANIAHTFGDGGGLSLIAKSSNRKLVLRSVLDHEPKMGKTGWQRVLIVVQLPPDTAWVTLAFLHQADGKMQVRNPFFGRAKPGSPACETSPSI